MSLAKTILEHVASLGYEIVVEAGAVTAIDKQTSEQYRVTFDDGDRYRAVCELWRLVGIELKE